MHAPEIELKFAVADIDRFRARAQSLGLTLVEVLTQRRPSDGVVPADLPEPFAGIARGCLLRNPADRLTNSARRL